VVLGMPELEAKLRELGDAVTGVLDRAVLAGAEPIAAEAARRAFPMRRTGQLAEDIRVVLDNDPGDEMGMGLLGRLAGARTTAIARVSPARRSFYGFFVEHGVSMWDIPARPFMRPAYDLYRDMAVRIVRDYIADAVRRVCP